MEEGNFRSRLFTEFSELQQRIVKLENFILGDVYDTLPDIDKEDLKEQRQHMQAYSRVLERRVSRQCGNA